MSGTILRNALYLANPVQLGNSRPTTPRPTPSASALPQIGGTDPNPPATVETGGERGRHRRTSQIDRNDQISNDYEISLTPAPGVQGRAAINHQSGPQPGNNRGRFTAEGTLQGRGARLAASLTTNVDPNGRATVAGQGSARLFGHPPRQSGTGLAPQRSPSRNLRAPGRRHHPLSRRRIQRLITRIFKDLWPNR